MVETFLGLLTIAFLLCAELPMTMLKMLKFLYFCCFLTSITSTAAIKDGNISLTFIIENFYDEILNFHASQNFLLIRTQTVKCFKCLKCLMCLCLILQTVYLIILCRHAFILLQSFTRALP